MLNIITHNKAPMPSEATLPPMEQVRELISLSNPRISEQINADSRLVTC